MLAAFFGLVVVASSVLLWRAVSKNQSARRYLEPQTDIAGALQSHEMDPERWAIVGPLRTLRRVVHGEIGGLEYGSSTVVTASLAVNAEIQHWLTAPRPSRLPTEHAKILDMLERQIDGVWEQGQWGVAGSLDETAFERRLRALEELLIATEAQLAKTSLPYRQ